MALSPDEKFIYVNPDTTTGEYNAAQYFPVKYLRGLECAAAANFLIYFRGPKDAKSTRITINITSGFIKEFFTQFVDEVNFGESAVITLADRNIAVDATTGGTDFQHVNASVSPVILSDVTLSGHEDVQVAEDLDVAGTITGDLTGDVTGDLTGNADTATALATARAINGVNFDGSAAITITAAGSTLSDTVTVAKGGTGATSLTTDGVLFGNGTSAVSAVDLSSSGNIVVGGSTPAAVTGANLAGSGLAATVGNGTLVLAVETLNQDTTGSAATLTTPRAINGVDFDGSAPITVTAAGSTLSDTVTVAKGGTGLTSVGSNNILTGNGTGALTSEANLQFSSSSLNLTSSVSGRPEINISSTHTTKDAQPVLKFIKASTGEDGENIGSIDFSANNDDDSTVLYAQILGEISDATDGEDGGKLTLSVASDDGNLAAGLVIEDGDAGGEVDATIGAGAASVTTVAGTLTMGSTAFVNNSGVVQVATQGTIDHDSLANFASNEHYTQANIVATGTIASGTWEGTDIGVAHGGTGASNLDAFGLLSGTQTFTGRKIINTRSFPISSGTDGNAIGDVVYFGGTTSMTIGTIYHYKSDGTWEVANANAVATSDGLLGVALGAASDTNGVLLRGMVTLDHDPGAVGDVLYLSNTNGDASSTAPSDNNDIVRVIGYCLHASAGNIWFNPDSTFVEVTA